MLAQLARPLPLLLLLLLLLPALAGQPSGGARSSETADRLRIRAGRARLVEESEVLDLTARSPARPLLPGSFLETMPGTEVELARPRLSSLRIFGPAQLEWDLYAKRSGWSRVLVPRFDRLELEIRRGGMVLDLPQGWRLWARPGSVQLREFASGEIYVHNHGGEPLAVESLLVRQGKAWPRLIRAGERARLPIAEE